MPYKPEAIYNSYLAEHFLIKQEMLRNIITEYDKYSELWHDFPSLEKEKILRSLKLEVKATLYQSIETLFQLIFALEPKDGRLRDKDLWKVLSKGEHGLNNKIDDYAKGQFDFSYKVNVNGEEIPFLQHLFYFANLGNEHNEKVKTSLPVIQKGLKVLAKEFKDRTIYNSYKHGLRLFKTLEKFEVIEKENKEKRITFDASDSVTYLENDKSDEDLFTLRVNLFDFERDYNLSLFASLLITNLIRSRKTTITKEKEDFYFFEEDFLEHLHERNIKWDDFKMGLRLK